MVIGNLGGLQKNSKYWSVEITYKSLLVALNSQVTVWVSQRVWKPWRDCWELKKMCVEGLERGRLEVIGKNKKERKTKMKNQLSFGPSMSGWGICRFWPPHPSLLKAVRRMSHLGCVCVGVGVSMCPVVLTHTYCTSLLYLLWLQLFLSF